MEKFRTMNDINMIWKDNKCIKVLAFFFVGKKTLHDASMAIEGIVTTHLWECDMHLDNVATNELTMLSMVVL